VPTSKPRGGARDSREPPAASTSYARASSTSSRTPCRGWAVRHAHHGQRDPQLLDKRQIHGQGGLQEGINKASSSDKDFRPDALESAGADEAVTTRMPRKIFVTPRCRTPMARSTSGTSWSHQAESGSAPENAGTRAALRQRRRAARRADMLKAESEGISPAAAHRQRIAAGAPGICRAFTSVSITGIRPIAENTQLSQDVYARPQSRRPRLRSGSAVLRTR